MYPKMEACDYVKLAFQCEFGCGHLLTDREAAYRMLLEEWDKVKTDGLEPLVVDIGGGYARLNLAAAKRCMTPELVFSMFEKSVTASGSREGFEHKIRNMRRAAAMGILPCNGDEIAAYAESLGDKLPSHSARYRRLYGANYRVITAEMATVAPICMLLADAGRKAERINVAIDGCAAAGKTTVTGLLGSLFDGNVISMDDYFLSMARKTTERLAMLGGNVDAERIRDEIMGERYADRLTHARFDCHKQTLLPPVTEDRKQYLFVEGVYALRPDLRDFYDVKILLTTDKESQRLRIWERGGEALWHRYETEWLPLEEAYFEATQPQLDADLIIYT
jgi:uridine kinase